MIGCYLQFMFESGLYYRLIPIFFSMRFSDRKKTYPHQPPPPHHLKVKLSFL